MSSIFKFYLTQNTKIRYSHITKEVITMNGYSNIIRTHLETIPTNTPIIARNLHNESFPNIPATSYYKALERFVKSNALVHLTKGIYYRPRITSLGVIPICEHDILNFYLNSNQGLIIGYRMFNEKGLTTQVSKRIDILSTNTTDQKKHVQNVHVQKIDIALNDTTASTIETLEILQNHRNIEDLNLIRLKAYMERFAQLYSDNDLDQVLKIRKYKKSTLASLGLYLDYFGIDNNIKRYLSPLSTYQTIDVEKLYEIL